MAARKRIRKNVARRQPSKKYLTLQNRLKKFAEKGKSPYQNIEKVQADYHEVLFSMAKEARKAGARIFLKVAKGKKVLERIDITDQPENIIRLYQQIDFWPLPLPPIWCINIGCPPITTDKGALCQIFGCYVAPNGGMARVCIYICFDF